MAIQLIGTALVHKAPPVERTVEDIKYKSYKLVHPGIKEPIAINALVVVGSEIDKQLSVFNEKSAKRAAAGNTEPPIRLVFTGTNATLNVDPSFEMGGGVSKDKRSLVEGTVHRLNGVDLLLMSARQTVMDLKAEPEQLTCTMIAQCDQDKWTKQIKVGDGLQAPLQPGQENAYSIRLLPDNAIVKETLHGIGDPNSSDFIPPASGIYFLSGSLVREAKSAQQASDSKNAFVAWDRIALQVSSAFELVIQDMESQKNVNASVAAHTPDVDYFERATSGEADAAPVSFSADVDALLS